VFRENIYQIWGFIHSLWNIEHLLRIRTSSGLTPTQYKFTKVLQLTHGLEDLLDMERGEVKSSGISFLFHFVYFTFH